MKMTKWEDKDTLKKSQGKHSVLQMKLIKQRLKQVSFNGEVWRGNDSKGSKREPWVI